MRFSAFVAFSATNTNTASTFGKGLLALDFAARTWKAFRTHGLCGGMMRNFEEFTFRSTPASGKQMRVAIQTRGTMSLNQAAYEKLGSPEKVILLFDKTSRAVGLKPTQENIRHAFPVRKQTGSKSYLIGATSFCQYHEIDTSVTRTFDPIIEEGILILEIDKGVEILSSRGRRKQPGQEQSKMAQAG